MKRNMFKKNQKNLLAILENAKKRMQIAAQFICCFIFHFILHIPILPPDLHFSCDLTTVAVGTSRSALIAFFPTLFSQV